MSVQADDRQKPRPVMADLFTTNEWRSQSMVMVGECYNPAQYLVQDLVQRSRLAISSSSALPLLAAEEVLARSLAWRHCARLSQGWRCRAERLISSGVTEALSSVWHNRRQISPRPLAHPW